jgi:hypothetical protein
LALIYQRYPTICRYSKEDAKVQPVDRDTQISLMKDAETRMDAFVREILMVSEVSKSAQRCAFEENGSSYSQKVLRVAR